MILKTYVILTGLLFLFTIAPAQCRLDIEITALRNDKGALMLQLYSENQEVLLEKKEMIRGGKCSIHIEELKPGKYAVRYFHDENLSGQMETNLVGKPAEGYGFSGNATGRFGPPPFEKWIFEVTADKKINLQPSY